MDYFFDPPERSAEPWLPALVGSTFADKLLCGRSLNRGLLRFHDSRSGPIGQELVEGAFAARGLRADVFAFDWLARQFAVTISGGTSRRVVLLDPFDMSISPWVDTDQFEGSLALPVAKDFLDAALFEHWLLAVGIDHLGLDYCAGACVPAFYGGKRELENLNHDDVDVYLSFTLQLWARAQSSPPGSRPPRLRLPDG